MSHFFFGLYFLFKQNSHAHITIETCCFVFLGFFFFPPIELELNCEEE